MKPIAWIKIRELSYMQAVAERGATEWKTNLGLTPEPNDEGLYTETQVQKMRESFEQSITDPENQPSQYGTVLQREWQGLTDEEAAELCHAPIAVIEAKLKEKNS
jgi:DNA-directed RNA polymerase specialized sigma24 family protein